MWQIAMIAMLETHVRSSIDFATLHVLVVACGVALGASENSNG